MSAILAPFSLVIACITGWLPVPERRSKTTWKEFLNRHWDQIVAADFFSIEVWTKAGLQRFMILFIWFIAGDYAD
jgi:hypothetical protein